MARLHVLSSLTNRIFAATVLLVVLAVGATALVIADRVTAESEVELRRGLAEAAGAVERHGATMSSTALLMATLVADLPKLKAAVVTGDGPTVLPLARDYRSMLPQSDLVAVTDAAGTVLAADTATPVLTDGAATWPSVAAALAGTGSIAYQSHPAGVRQLVSVPITLGRAPGELAGTLSIGFLLDAGLAAEFKALTGSEISFALDGTVRASTLPPAHWAALAEVVRAGTDTSLRLGAGEFVARAQTVGRLPGGAAGAPGGPLPVVIVARSRSERLLFLETIRAVTVVSVVSAVLAATLLSYAVARTITRPLAAITDTMRLVASTGDLTRKIPLRSGLWEDEDARLLATTFNGLIDAVARFEREAAQRERLSALGRLSSVIAHEIRNPLMIIKASVRALRSAAGVPATVTEAAADIDEEVVRLNRLVNDVLDFSRPITFEVGPTDINGLCAEAVRAMTAGEPAVPIALDLASDLAPISTDGERVRAVLINALTNAAQAVSAGSGARPGGPADIRVTTTRRGDGGVCIAVDDTGPGIDAALLPRVFEPFVTTRRGGTGLGLAIARNVIEGLGGHLELTSVPGAGTTLTINLPAAAPAESPSGQRGRTV